MTMVTIQHTGALRYCNRGARRWLARFGVDWSDFLKNGIDSEKLRATGDAMAIKAADLAESKGEKCQAAATNK